jgi:hypothetical protein
VPPDDLPQEPRLAALLCELVQRSGNFAVAQEFDLMRGRSLTWDGRGVLVPPEGALTWETPARSLLCGA